MVAVLHLSGVASGQVHAWLMGFLAANQVALLTSGLIGAITLVCAAMFFGGLGFFNILYVMAKVVYELTQLLLCAMAIASLVFWFDLGANLWLEGGGTLAIVLYVWLYGAAFSLRIFDFNHPIKDVLLSFSVLPFFCLAVFWASGLIR